MSDNNIKEIVKEELNKDNRKFYIRVIFVMLAVIIVYYAILAWGFDVFCQYRQKSELPCHKIMQKCNFGRQKKKVRRPLKAYKYSLYIYI